MCDDGSTDGSRQKIKEFAEAYPQEFRLFLKEHEGITAIARNLNELIESATGDYIAFLAGDDSYLENRFSDQIDVLEGQQKIVISYALGVNCVGGRLSGLAMTNPSFCALYSKDPKSLYEHVTTQMPLIFIQGMLADAKFLQSFRPFDDSLIADDWVFNIRVAEKLIQTGKGFHFSAEPVFVRNIHEANTSRNPAEHLPRILEVARKYFTPENFRKFKYSILKSGLRSRYRTPLKAFNFLVIYRKAVSSINKGSGFEHT